MISWNASPSESNRKAKQAGFSIRVKGMMLSPGNRSAREVRMDILVHNDSRALHRREAYELHCIHFISYWKQPKSASRLAACQPFSYRNSLLALTSAWRVRFGGWLAADKPRLGVCPCRSNCAGKPSSEKKQLAGFSQSTLRRNPNTVGTEKPLVCLAKLRTASRDRNVFC